VKKRERTTHVLANAAHFLRRGREIVEIGWGGEQGKSIEPQMNTDSHRWLFICVSSLKICGSNHLLAFHMK